MLAHTEGLGGAALVGGVLHVAAEFVRSHGVRIADPLRVAASSG
jgi:hypothetical protein